MAIFEFGSGVDGTEGKLGPAVIADLEIGRFDEIEIVAVPQIGLDDPPSASEFTGDRAGLRVEYAFSRRWLRSVARRFPEIAVRP